MNQKLKKELLQGLDYSFKSFADSISDNFGNGQDAEELWILRKNIGEKIAGLRKLNAKLYQKERQGIVDAEMCENDTNDSDYESSVDK